ncbi:MAG: carotenoid biosynthesis protein [Candidatus Methylomirabilaceae bacterium]
MVETLELLISTVLLRPYVFLFLALYLWTASSAMGWGRTALFTALAWGVSFAAEYSSTRNGIPFGFYTYIEATKGRELWISNVPFMDSLSFTFVSYVSFALAQWLRLPDGAGEREIVAVRRSVPVLCLATFLFMLIDVVIDPVALRGDRWFLGKIYEYPSPGFYFGVPLTNFVGWGVVGFAIIALFQRIDRALPERATSGRGVRPVLLGAALYYLILAFNLYMTFVIGEHLLGIVGIMLYLPITLLAVKRYWRLSGIPGFATRGAVRT